MPPVGKNTPAPKPPPTVRTSPNGPPKKPRTVEEKREVIYPVPDSTLCFGAKALTEQKVVDILGWETEEEYKVRMKAEAEATGDVRKGGAAMAGYGDQYLLKDTKGRKVRCWNNSRNRPFTEAWAKALAQDMLHSGPGIKEEERRWQPNGEAVILGTTGVVHSGQHRLIGFKLACELWAKDDKYKRIWPQKPTLETNVVRGISEADYVVRTLDNVKPRSLSDVFYTSTLFADLPDAEKKTCSNTLDTAVDLLWKRTGASGRMKFQTHGESVDFLDRHKRLLACVKRMFVENRDGFYNGLRLSPGVCAALMYLMASSASDRNHYEKTWSEKTLDFSLWDKAEDFFVELQSSSREKGLMKELVVALHDLIETEEGGRGPEKNALIVRAWMAYKLGAQVTAKTLELAYGEDSNGNRKLKEFPTVGGIDMGDKYKAEAGDADESKVSEAEVEAAKEEARKKRQADMDAAAKKATTAKKK